MTGTVDWQTLAWLGGIVVTVLSLNWRIQGWANAELRKRDLAIETSNARAKIAEDALAKVISDHKLYAAEHYITRDILTGEMEDVKKSIDRLANLIDVMLTQGRASGTPRRVRPEG